MKSTTRTETRKQLEREIENGRYQELLETLRAEDPFFRRFRTWMDVVAFMHTGVSCDPEKERIITAIMNRHQADRDARWRTILLVIFVPALGSIHSKRDIWDDDADDRWQLIVLIFLEVLCRHDLNQRSYRLVQKLVNETAHRLGDDYRRRQRRAEREVLMAPELFDLFVGPVEGVDFTGLELRETQETEIKRLQRHLAVGTISETDFSLLANTRVYGKKLTAYAREVGLTYETAKKRRYRAEAAIRKAEKKFVKNVPVSDH